MTTEAVGFVAEAAKAVPSVQKVRSVVALQLVQAASSAAAFLGYVAVTSVAVAIELHLRLVLLPLQRTVAAVAAVSLAAGPAFGQPLQLHSPVAAVVLSSDLLLERGPAVACTAPSGSYLGPHLVSRISFPRLIRL